ncbi:MAG: HAD family phosphatase [Planctomycetota bacterium]
MNPSDKSCSVNASVQPRPPRPIQGIALDMDGLLFDTERLYWQVSDQVLIRRGFRYSRALQARMMGRVGVAAIEQMIAFHDLNDDPVSLLHECERMYEEALADGLQPMAGLRTWIGRLQQSKIPFGLATSSRRKFVDRILATTDWAESLEFVLTGDDVTNGKPHPEIYLKAAERLSIDPSSMLVLEDSGNGCAAAVAAQAITVAVPSEHTRDQNFSGAFLKVDSLLDPKLLALIPSK